MTANPPPLPPPEPREPGRIERRVLGFLVKRLFFRGRRGGPWPVPPGLPHQALSFEGNSGARLAARHFPAEGQARGIVVLCHPDRRYGQHWFVREGWVAWLRGHGYDALTFDFAVYGGSRGGSTYLHDDVAAACREARRLRPDLPLHVIGLSLGAFAAANASASWRLPDVEGLVLESPYPDFDAWFAHGGENGAGPAANRLLGRLFARSYARIDAGRNVRAARARRILVAGAVDDEVTAIELTRQVARAAPPGRTRTLELEGVPHLGLFAREAYRRALLETLSGASEARPAAARAAIPAASPAALPPQ